MWLGEQIDVPGSKEGATPRMVLYLEEKVTLSFKRFQS